MKLGCGIFGMAVEIEKDLEGSLQKLAAICKRWRLSGLRYASGRKSGKRLWG